MVEWPDGYEGNGGVGISERKSGSSSARMSVTGRFVQNVNLAFQQAMKASA